MASGFWNDNPGEHIRRLQQMAEQGPCRELELLSGIQVRTSRNCLRLAAVDRQLHVRARSRARSAGAMVADAVEAERRRIGRELHTGVGQALAGIRVHVSLLRDSLPAPEEALRKGLDRVDVLAGAALDQVRNVSRRLYVPSWQARELADALRNLWESSGIPERFEATLQLEPLSREPAPEVRRALYLAAQEGISNLIQHANARRVRMSLMEPGGRVRLVLEDDGSGFAPTAAAAPAGIGLRSLGDLAQELGGDFQATSGAQGARLTMSFPVTHE